MISAPQHASLSRRWLAHLVSAKHAEPDADAAPGAAPVFAADAVLELARHEQVAPLIYLGCVEQRVSDALPIAFRADCETSYYRALRANIAALKAGGRILDAFRMGGIAAAPIDGWAVLQGPFRYYADNGSRPLEEIEVVIRESDQARAAAVLVELGYHCASPPDGSGRIPAEATRWKSRDGSNLPVVARWGWEGFASPVSRISVSGDDFLDHLCDTTLFGYHRATRTANLVVASVRATGIERGRWLRLADVHQLISVAPVDWEEVIASACRWRVRAPLYAALVAAQDLFGTAVPRGVRKRLAPGPVRRLLLDRSQVARQWEEGTTRAARALLGESWWEVARAAARSVVPRGASQPGWGR